MQQGLFGEPTEITRAIVDRLDLGSVASLIRCAKRFSGMIPADSPYRTKKAAFDAAMAGDFQPAIDAGMEDVLDAVFLRLPAVSCEFARNEIVECCVRVGQRLALFAGRHILGIHGRYLSCFCARTPDPWIHVAWYNDFPKMGDAIRWHEIYLTRPCVRSVDEDGSESWGRNFAYVGRIEFTS